MYYKKEKYWQPKELYDSERKQKRDFIKFENKINNKSTEFIKYIYKNILSDGEKHLLYVNFNISVKFILHRHKTFDSNKILYEILKEILDLNIFNSLKRKWIIKNLLKNQL